MGKNTEPTVNAVLAGLLRTKHPKWANQIDAEQTSHLSDNGRPDILVNTPNATPVIVETEFLPAATVEKDACARLGKTLVQTGDKIEQTLAVRLPKQLASVKQHTLNESIEAARFDYCVHSVHTGAIQRWPSNGWINATIDELARAIELAQLSEQRIAQGMYLLEQGVKEAAGKLRLECSGGSTLKEIARHLHQEEAEQTTRMAMAIVVNAMMFQSVIAGTHGIKTLEGLKGPNGEISKRETLKVWRKILTEINYWPIFKIASDILTEIPNSTATILLDRLAGLANELADIGITSQHDLCGKMFQRLITDRKFLATFYTLPTSAALLSELAVARLAIDWSNPEAVKNLKIADFACGTGALLNAAYEAILARYRRAGGDDEAIHPAMMKNALVGCDIMPAATHLTATMLASRHPTITFEGTGITILPYGCQGLNAAKPITIGALDLIEEEKIYSLFDTGHMRVLGKMQGMKRPVDMRHGSFDLVIMNPPFTRPTNHEATDARVPSFAAFDMTDADQQAMSRQLKKLRPHDGASHGNAGLASNFIDLAHAKVKPDGGILACVLPGAFMHGGAWKDARDLIDAHYTDITIASIATSGNTERAFSYETGMAEILLVA